MKKILPNLASDFANKRFPMISLVLEPLSCPEPASRQKNTSNPFLSLRYCWQPDLNLITSFLSFINSANYQQVKVVFIFGLSNQYMLLFLQLTTIYSVHFPYQKYTLLCWQVTGKLNYAQYGIYFIYRGAVSGSSAFNSFSSTASLINLEMLPEEDSCTPNRSLNELFVNCSPCTYLIHACI